MAYGSDSILGSKQDDPA